MEPEPERVCTALGILADRYGLDRRGAASMLLDWAGDTGLSVSTLAAWIVEDAPAVTVQVPQARRGA